jgi:hypothetical protein
MNHPCGRNQSPKNNRFRGQAGFPACRNGCTKLHRECGRRQGGRRQSGPHNHDQGNGGQVRERSWIARPGRSVASLFLSSCSRFPESILPTISDHEPVFLEDLSHHRHGSWWAGSVGPRVIRLAPLVGAWQPPRVPSWPVRGQFAHTRPNPAPRTPIQQYCVGRPR